MPATPWGLSFSFDGGPVQTVSDVLDLLVTNSLGGIDQGVFWHAPATRAPAWA